MPEPFGVTISGKEGEGGRVKQREIQQLGTGQYLPQHLSSPLGATHLSRLETLHRAHAYPSPHLGAVGATSTAREGAQMLSQHVHKTYAPEKLDGTCVSVGIAGKLALFYTTEAFLIPSNLEKSGSRDA